MSLIATPVRAVLVGLVSVNVITEKSATPFGMVDGLNDFVTVGDASTVRVPEAPGPAVGVWNVVTPLTLLTYTFPTVAVTSTSTVQLPFAGMFTPAKATDNVAPAAFALGMAPVQVPLPPPIKVCAAAVVVMFGGNVSVNDAPVRGVAFGFVNVNVMIDVPLV